MLRVIAKLFTTVQTYLMSPEAYARKIGVKVGKGCFISTRRWSTEPYLVEIGDRVQLTRGVMIHTHGGGNAVRNIFPDFDTFGKVIIDDDAYIGAYSQIMPGVRIGKNSIVAAGSVVTKSVPDGVVVGGNPARYICTVKEYVERNAKYNLHTYGMTVNEKKKYLTSVDDDRLIVKPYIKKM